MRLPLIGNRTDQSILTPIYIYLAVKRRYSALATTPRVSNSNNDNVCRLNSDLFLKKALIRVFN